MNREMRRLAEREERRQGERGRRSPVAKQAAPGSEQGRLGRLFQFLREVRVELLRVAWPSRKQMVAFTTVTVITSTILTAFVFVLDVAFGRVVLSFIRMLTG